MKNSAPHLNASLYRSHTRTRTLLLIGLIALVAFTAYAAGGLGGGEKVDEDYVATGTDWGLLIFFVCLSTGVSFLCSIAEAVLLSISPSFVEKLKSEGSPFAQELGKMKENIERPLSTILTLNTIAHTVGALGSGLMSTPSTSSSPPRSCPRPLVRCTTASSPASLPAASVSRHGPSSR